MNSNQTTDSTLGSMIDAMYTALTGKWAGVRKPKNGRGSDSWVARMDRLADVRVQMLARKMERVHAEPEEVIEMRRIRRKDRLKAARAK